MVEYDDMKIYIRNTTAQPHTISNSSFQNLLKNLME